MAAKELKIGRERFEIGRGQSDMENQPPKSLKLAPAKIKSAADRQILVHRTLALSIENNSYLSIEE